MEMYADGVEDQWGTGYKVAMRKLNCFRTPATTCAARLRSIVCYRFQRKVDIIYSVGDMRSPEQEFDSACRELKLNKASGIDEIPSITLKAAIESNTELFR